MTLNLNPVDRMIAKLQTVNSLIRRLNKLTKELEDPSLSRESRRHRFSAIQLASESLELQRHEVHCEAVALGIADPMARRYGSKTIATAYGTAILFFRDPNEDPILTADPGPQQPTPLELQIHQAEQAGKLHLTFDEMEPEQLASYIEHLEGDVEYQQKRQAGGLSNNVDQAKVILEEARTALARHTSRANLKAMESETPNDVTVATDGPYAIMEKSKCPAPEPDPVKPHKRSQIGLASKKRRKTTRNVVQLAAEPDPELPEKLPLDEDGLPQGMQPASVI